MHESSILREIFLIIKKRLILILTITILLTGASGLFSYYFITPIYQTSAQILIGDARDDAVYQGNEIDKSLRLINTYNVIIQSPKILELVQKDLGLEQSIKELNEQINVSSAKESQVILITVEDPNPQSAVNIANTLAKVFQTEIQQMMQVNNVSILSKAGYEEQPRPVKPRPILIGSIALVIGLVGGSAISLLLESIDNRVKSEQEISQYVKLPILGEVSVIKGKKGKKRIAKSKRAYPTLSDEPISMQQDTRKRNSEDDFLYKEIKEGTEEINSMMSSDEVATEKVVDKPIHGMTNETALPTGSHGVFIKRKWLQMYDHIPTVIDEQMLSIMINDSIDEEQTYTVQLWGTSGDRKYLLNQEQGRISNGVSRMFLEQVMEKNSGISSVLIEERYGSWIYSIGSKRNLTIKTFSIDGKKMTHFFGAQPDLERGNLYIPDITKASWVHGFIEECVAFPLGEKDDQVLLMTLSLMNL